MSAINSQPSPFGHLTRERHIESVAKSSRTKRSSSELPAGEMSHIGNPGATSAMESDSIGVLTRSPPSPVTTQGGLAHTCATKDHGRSRSAWVASETAVPGARLPGALASCPLLFGCQGRQEGCGARPIQEQEDHTHTGVEVLAGIQQLCITSKAELYGFVSNSRRRAYVIAGDVAERGLLVATEDYSDCCFHVCGPARSCHLYLQDQEGRVVLWFCRPFRVGFGCLRCCQTEIRVFTNANQLIGTVRQRCSIFSQLLEVCDARGLPNMTIHGSCITSRCCSTQEFQVLSSTDCVVGSIWKKWPGFSEERNMDHEFFGVDIAVADLSNKERACLLAGAFLLNFMFFEVS